MNKKELILFTNYLISKRVRYYIDKNNNVVYYKDLFISGITPMTFDELINDFKNKKI